MHVSKNPANRLYPLRTYYRSVIRLILEACEKGLEADGKEAGYVDHFRNNLKERDAKSFGEMESLNNKIGGGELRVNPF